jgi:hypothetical protein
MSCTSNVNQKTNIMPKYNQLYRLTYPEKNAQWWSPVPDNCTRERQKECCQRMLYTPTPANQCKSTFMPWDRPDPYQCLKMCKGIDVFKVNGCQAQNLRNKQRIPTNGCLMEPSIMEYTNIPFNKPCVKGSCKSESILTDPMRNPPPPPEYGMKYSNTYDPIRWTYGDPYTY